MSIFRRAIPVLLTIGCAIYLISCAMVDTVQLLSEPPGAKVYLVPLYSAETDTSLVSNDAKLAEYLVQEGPTPVITRALEKRYVAVFDLNGTKRTKRIDVIRGHTNKAKVIFP